MMSSYKVISLQLNHIKYQDALLDIIKKAKDHQSIYCCFANAHMTIEAYKDVNFAKQVNNANYVFADGKPLVIVLKLLYGIQQERIAGMDFLPDFIEKLHEEKLSVFLYGSSLENLKIMQQKIKKQYPGCQVVGAISPPYRDLTSQEHNQYLENIKAAKPHAVLVSLGCPKQEKWCAENYQQIPAVFLAVGGAFATFAGLQKRAPAWMQKYALEWLFRLFLEPRRLWKRYLVTNSYFVWLFLKQKLLKN